MDEIEKKSKELFDSFLLDLDEDYSLRFELKVLCRNYHKGSPVEENKQKIISLLLQQIAESSYLSKINNFSLVDIFNLTEDKYIRKQAKKDLRRLLADLKISNDKLVEKDLILFESREELYILLNKIKRDLGIVVKIDNGFCLSESLVNNQETKNVSSLNSFDNSTSLNSLESSSQSLENSNSSQSLENSNSSQSLENSNSFHFLKENRKSILKLKETKLVCPIITLYIAYKNNRDENGIEASLETIFRIRLCPLSLYKSFEKCKYLFQNDSDLCPVCSFPKEFAESDNFESALKVFSLYEVVNNVFQIHRCVDNSIIYSSEEINKYNIDKLFPELSEKIMPFLRLKHPNLMKITNIIKYTGKASGIINGYVFIAEQTKFTSLSLFGILGDEKKKYEETRTKSKSLIDRKTLVLTMCEVLLFLHNHGTSHGDFRSEKIIMQEGKYILSLPNFKAYNSMKEDKHPYLRYKTRNEPLGLPSSNLKEDVYAFGHFLIELFGMTVSNIHIKAWDYNSEDDVLEKLRKGRIPHETKYIPYHAIRELAELCLEVNSCVRPSMKKVQRMLMKIPFEQYNLP